MTAVYGFLFVIAVAAPVAWLLWRADVPVARRTLRFEPCRVPTCPNARTTKRTQSVWCDDHTDAIFADSSASDWRREAAVRVGTRRWLLKAEVDAELERQSVAVLDAIGEMDPVSRATPMNRACWDTGAVKLADRVDELVLLGVLAPPARCPDGSWSRDGSRHCSLPMFHAGPHEYETTGEAHGRSS